MTIRRAQPTSGTKARPFKPPFVVHPAPKWSGWYTCGHCRQSCTGSYLGVPRCHRCASRRSLAASRSNTVGIAGRGRLALQVAA